MLAAMSAIAWAALGAGSRGAVSAGSSGGLSTEMKRLYHFLLISLGAYWEAYSSRVGGVKEGSSGGEFWRHPPGLNRRPADYAFTDWPYTACARVYLANYLRRLPSTLSMFRGPKSTWVATKSTEVSVCLACVYPVLDGHGPRFCV